MPRCKNCPPLPNRGYYYTGNENTPLGRGFSARSEEEGKRMKGGDGQFWIVSGGRWIKGYGPDGVKLGEEYPETDAKEVRSGDEDEVCYHHPVEKVIVCVDVESWIVREVRSVADYRLDHRLQQDIVDVPLVEGIETDMETKKVLGL